MYGSGSGGDWGSVSNEDLERTKRQMAEDAEFARTLQEEERRRASAGGVFTEGWPRGAPRRRAGPSRHRVEHELAEMVEELRTGRSGAFRVLESLGALMEARELQARRGAGGAGEVLVLCGVPFLGGGGAGVLSRRGLQLLGFGDLGDEDLTYEDLLDLEERMGGPVGRGASSSVIEALPETRHRVGAGTGGAGPTSAESCSVCLEEYAEGDRVRTLPCGHQFHSRCVDRWLQNNRACPICKKEIC